MQTESNVTILDAEDSVSWGSPKDVQDVDKIGLYVATDNSANLTIKIAGSMQEARPDFGTAASVSNPWDYVAVYDLQDASLIDGDTGVAFTTDVVQQYQVNTDNLRWICAEVSLRSAGDVTVIMAAAKND